jgi:hypothetical protein
MRAHPSFPRWIKFPYGVDPSGLNSIPTTIPTSEELASRFEQCLADATNEQTAQDFLEEYPHILPGVDTFHNGPLGDIIIAKFRLNNDFITDFAFVSENSQAMEMTFVEIESPGKPLFKRDGSFSRDYLDARQQLADWNAWGQQELRTVAKLFGPFSRGIPNSRYIDLTLRCVLIMGRRSELNSRKRQERWAAENALRHASMAIMTYDRLIERIRHELFWPLHKRLLVCSYRDREFQVKRIAI